MNTHTLEITRDHARIINNNDRVLDNAHAIIRAV